MKNRKFGLLFVLAAVGVMLLTACNDLYNPLDDLPNFAPMKTPPRVQPIKKGYGRVTIVVGGGEVAARTVVPGGSPSFDSYEYYFKKGNGSEEKKDPDSGSDSDFTLEVGTYTVRVVAFTSSISDAVAEGTGAFEVKADQSPTVTIKLSPLSVTDTTTTGTFEYDITIPSGTTLTATLKKYPSGTEVNLSSTGKGSETGLTGGSYLLTVRLEKGIDYAGLVEAVHIIPGLITTFTYEFDSADLINKTYIVTFNKNGGDTEANPTSKRVTSPATNVGTLPTPPTRTGYTFTGWNTQSDGLGTEFEATTTVDASIIVYAKWTAKTFIVNFDVNGGDGPAPSSITVTYPNKTLGSLPTAPTRTGYTFDGWFDDAGTTEYTASTPELDTVNGGSITVKAKWTVISYTVTFDRNNTDALGVGVTEADPKTKTVTYPADTVDALPTPPTRTGYTFAGWNTQSDGLGTEFEATTTVDASIIVYAKWTANTYSIALSETGTYAFTDAVLGYTSAPTALDVDIENKSSVAVGPLTVGLSGSGASSFTVVGSPISNINAGATATAAFSVQPNTGLGIGTYTATVTVSGGSGITAVSANFTVSFTVNPAPTGINISWETVNDDSIFVDGTRTTSPGVAVDIEVETTGVTTCSWYLNGDSTPVATGLTYSFLTDDIGDHKVTVVLGNGSSIISTFVMIKVQ